MKTMKKIITMTAAMAFFTGQIQGQECCDDTCAAYADCNRATTMSALIPLGALALAAILIATTDRHHHHGSSSCDSGSSSGSSYSSSGSGSRSGSSFSHSHF